MAVNKVRLRPSIASADPIRIAGAIDSLGSWPYLHLDIEDGCFVPNITFGMRTVKAIAGYAKGEIDVHLMVRDPLPYIPALAALGVKSASVHAEAVGYPLEALGAIRRAGMAAGLALNFKTAPESLEPFLDALDYLLVMTAEPDGGGQRFSPALLKKLRRARAMLSDRQALWADGGIDRHNLIPVVEAGATDIVLGRAAFEGGPPEMALSALAALL